MTKEGKLLRPRGSASNPLILSTSCLIGMMTMITGIWVPFAFESVAWKHDLEHPDLAESRDNQGKAEPLIFKYPLMRMISRITLGAKIHNSRIKLVTDLPLLLHLIKAEKFSDADTLLLDLFSIGAFDEKTELVIWLQKTLKENGQLQKKIQSNETILSANREDREQIITDWQKLISDFRDYLHVSPVAETEPSEAQDKCTPDNCERYQQGPLRGIPQQPELPEAPASLEIFGKWYVKQLSAEEKEKITDDAITQPLVVFREKASALATSYRQNTASNTKLRKALNEDHKLMKSNTYLMAKKLEDPIKIASAPPGIIFGDLIA